MDLWEFYECVETLIRDLRSAGLEADSEEVESAMRGGATSGEVLGRLAVALPEVARQDPGLRDKADDLAAWATAVLQG
ncbi:MAG TPA: hypothetical protein VFH56_01460 [Acidimicrobiales bacterium]|nr:hypothetical protein [Acidimicrobiales bacterium]